MDMIKNFLGEATDLAVGLIALGVAVNLVFGGGAAFVPDVIGNITSITASLGESGLVGLIVALLILNLVKR